MSIDVSKIRPGDKVTLVPLEVVDAYHDSIIVTGFKGLRSAFSFDQIAAHRPAPREIGVGDRVRDRSHLAGEVIAIAEGYAMVRWPGSNVTATQYRYLTLVEGDQ